MQKSMKKITYEKEWDIGTKGFQYKWILLARNCEPLRASEFNCAQFRNNCAQINASKFLALCSNFFYKIQFKPYGTQEMQLIIAQFLSTTKYSI